ncbi:MAG: DNA repair protein RecO [Clostridiales bacterium]|nr:DNA repair protein RecO [Clostridiales bacterium]
MNEKIKGVVVKLIDYLDADKLASIFTLEEGIITAKFTGVRREKAKMKAVAQPFVFAEFSVAEKNNHKTVISADVIDSFPGILSNYNKTICGYIVLDAIKTIIPKEKSEPDLFLLTLSSLKNIETQNEYIATAEFLLKFIDFSGMTVQFVDADNCYLDVNTGNFSTLREIGSVAIDKKVYSILKNIKNEEEFEFNEHTLKQVVRLLGNIVYLKFGEIIKAIEFI